MNFKRKRTFSQIKSQKKLLLNDKMDISLTKILGSEECQTIISECREFRDRIYTPLQTIFQWRYLKQLALKLFSHVFLKALLFQRSFVCVKAEKVCVFA